MSEVVVEIKRTGFPVKIGEASVWFDTSVENLARFFDFEAEATRRLNELEKEIVAANLGKEITEETITKETTLGAINLETKLLKIQYDLLFGDGTFDKVYSLYPDYQALENTLEILCNLIADKLEELKIEREAVVKERMAQYTKKPKTARKTKE